MRYRKLDASGDFSFGANLANFWVDQPEAVAQAISTRLQLWTGEWFLDLTAGTPWTTQVVGTGTASLRDAAIRGVILGTTGVRSILQYSSTLNPDTRHFHVQATVDTIFGPIPVTTVIPLSPFTLDISPLGGSAPLLGG